jgi:hypothetical protein
LGQLFGHKPFPATLKLDPSEAGGISELRYVQYGQNPFSMLHEQAVFCPWKQAGLQVPKWPDENC